MATKKKKEGSSRTIPPDKTQVNFNLKAEDLEKIKVIAFKEGATNSELFNLAIKKFIELYEKKNGKVQIAKQKGEGLKEL